MHRIKIGVWAAVLATCVGACVTAEPSNNSPQAEAHLQAQPQAATPSAADQPSSADLGTQCLLHFTDQQQAPKFDYDQFQLRPEDRTVLEQVARCITAGPFKGHKIHLIGRADPRGHAEYNLALSDRRVGAVIGYLKQLGVDSSQVATSTRGALDASGKDEHSWRLDRRVDLELQP